MAIKFDLNTALLNSVTEANFVSATLSLFCMSDNAGTEKTSIYRITTDWNANEATWLHAKSDVLWQPGKDSASQGGGDTTYNLSSTAYAANQSWENYDITQAIKDFLGGTSNYGFLIIGDDRQGWTEAQSRLYASSDLPGLIQSRPKITIRTTDTKIINNSNNQDFTKNISFTYNDSYLNLSVPYSSCQVSINNIKGQKILSVKANSKNIKLPLSELSTGVHLMNITHNNRSETVKFTIYK